MDVFDCIQRQKKYFINKYYCINHEKHVLAKGIIIYLLD